MKVRYKIVRAPKVMEPNKVYGARIEKLSLENGNAVLGIAIFGHKHRKGKASKHA